jgi:hypothetical protein
LQILSCNGSRGDVGGLHGVRLDVSRVDRVLTRQCDRCACDGKKDRDQREVVLANVSPDS